MRKFVLVLLLAGVALPVMADSEAWVTVDRLSRRTCPNSKPESNSFQNGNSMRQRPPFRIVLSATSGSLAEQRELFALLNLGLVQSLASGVLSPTAAVERFYHADNCLYVRKHFREKEADAIMSHGVQLPDLFEGLPVEEAQREFYHELETIRCLCLKLLEKGYSSRVGERVTA
jgi:hypothetical protein